MIGGYDFLLWNTLPEPDALSLLVAMAKTLWPDCILEPCDTNPNEIFVYETQEAKDSWDANGATPENDSKMIHLIVSEDRVTIVFSGDTESTRKYIGMVLAAKDNDGVFPFWFY